jgi:hypothetical protein
MTWAMQEIGQHPEVLKELHKEVELVFGDSDRPATMEDLDKLTVCAFLKHCCYSEILVPGSSDKRNAAKIPVSAGICARNRRRLGSDEKREDFYDSKRRHLLDSVLQTSPR